jgi:hypothetical protein
MLIGRRQPSLRHLSPCRAILIRRPGLPIHEVMRRATWQLGERAEQRPPHLTPAQLIMLTGATLIAPRSGVSRQRCHYLNALLSRFQDR